jgi:hypothetical protein
MSLPDPDVAERETQALALRRAGLTFDLIAQKIGYADPSGARAAYQRALQRIVYSDVEEIRNEEKDRLDIAQAAIWDQVLHGEPPAIHALIKIMERRAKLLGLDMPVKIQQEITVWNGDADLDREIQDLIARVSGNGDSAEEMADRPSQTGTVTTSG